MATRMSSGRSQRSMRLDMGILPFRNTRGGHMGHPGITLQWRGRFCQPGDPLQAGQCATLNRSAMLACGPVALRISLFRVPLAQTARSLFSACQRQGVYSLGFRLDGLLERSSLCPDGKECTLVIDGRALVLPERRFACGGRFARTSHRIGSRV